MSSLVFSFQPEPDDVQGDDPSDALESSASETDDMAGSEAAIPGILDFAIGDGGNNDASPPNMGTGETAVGEATPDDGLESDQGVTQSEPIAGSSGDDTLLGSAGDDEMFGSSGADELYGYEGSDTLSGEAGDDRMESGSGDDSLLGGDGDDALHGRADDDTLRGGGGADTLLGGAGDDLLVGYEETDDFAQDFLNGGEGNDTLMLGSNDWAFGGQGEDVFVLGGSEAAGPANLMDFDPETDQVVFLYEGDGSGQVPSLEVRLSKNDPTISEIVVDGKVFATVATQNAPFAEEISIIDAI
ncbi:calcium-binding protein [Primorskyibacter sp. 2E233]|uniref:calcium-binding protein n=1 Tax=Primorskyibacter sp. 2E233 TaxID=3413431 RepID=UPI003BEFEAB2